MATFFATVRVRSKGDRKDRVHRFYVTDVRDEAEAREVLKREEPLLYGSSLAYRHIRDTFEECEPGPLVIDFGTYLDAPKGGR
jgi:hypothetical protein